MRGRNPAGPQVVEHLEGSPEAKERGRIILETMMGRLRVVQACAGLGLCAQRYRQLRDEFVQGGLERMEGRPAGRPRRAAEADEVAALRQQVAALQRALQVAQVREEIALALPHVKLTPAPTEESAAP